SSETKETQAAARKDGLVALCVAIAAGVAVKLPAFFGRPIATYDTWYARNASLFVLPLLTGYFVWKRHLAANTARWLVLPFIAAALLVNVPSFTRGGAIEILTTLHLPIALWLAVGIAYAGGRWSQPAGRM